MAKRKRTNGCLLSCLKIVATMSFVLLLGGFGIYILGTQYQDYFEALQIKLVQAMIERSIPVEEDDKAYIPVAIEEMYELDDLGKPLIEVNELGDSDKEVESLTEQHYLFEEEILHEEMSYIDDISQLEIEESANEPEIKEGTNQPEIKEDIEEDEREESNLINESSLLQIEDTQETILLIENTDEQNEEVGQVSEVIEGLNVPIFDIYNLALSEDMITDMERIAEGDEEALATIVVKYFGHLELEEKFQLLALIGSKMKTIDVPYVWGLVADGISDEDLVVLNEVIEEHFTEEEVDLMYDYYENSEFAEMYMPSY